MSVNETEKFTLSCSAHEIACVTCKWFSIKRRRRLDWNDPPAESSVPAKHYAVKWSVEKAESFNSLDYKDRLLPPLPFERQDENYIDHNFPHFASPGRNPDVQRPAVARTRETQAKERIITAPSTQRLDYRPKPNMEATQVVGQHATSEAHDVEHKQRRIKRKPVPVSQTLGQSLPNHPLNFFAQELGRSDSLKRQKGSNRKAVVNPLSERASVAFKSPLQDTVVVTRARTPRLVDVVRAYAPALPDELNVRIGDVLRVHEDYKDGWCLAQRAGRIDEEKGVVPQLCIRDRVDFISKHASLNNSISIVFMDPYRISSNVSQQRRFL